MSLTSFIRDLQRIPERIPGPGAVLYNAVPARLLKKPELKLALMIAGKVRRGTIVDLGSGTGYLSIEIARNAPDVTVYGIDLSRKMVDIARRHSGGIENVRFELANAARLPFDDGSVDFVVSTGSLHHWKRPVEVFNECHRVLKEGGEGWIFDGYPDFLREQAERSITEYGWWHCKLWSLVLRFHGFTDEEYRTRIRRILDQTMFKDCHGMEPVDMWMKISLRKGR